MNKKTSSNQTRPASTPGRDARAGRWLRVLALPAVLAAAASLSGCIYAPPYGYAPAPAPAYGYAYGPGYYPAPAVSVGVGVGGGWGGGYYGHGHWH